MHDSILHGSYVRVADNFHKSLKHLPNNANGSYTCSKCFKIYPTWSKYSKHLNIHREGRHACNICGRKFHTPAGLRTHVVARHEDKRNHSCDLCNYRAHTKGNLQLHVINVHTKDYPFKCDTCKRGFFVKSALEAHQRLRHEGLHFVCGVCKKIMKDKSHFKVHVSKHAIPESERNKFKCEFCPKRFDTERDIQRHITCIHVKVKKPQICDICGKSVKGMIAHKRQHAGVKSFVCDKCGKTFISRDGLDTHIRVHTKEKPYKCGTCGKSFSQKSTLTIHERIHSGLKPYKCEICTKGFVSKSALKIHRCKGTLTSN